MESIRGASVLRNVEGASHRVLRYLQEQDDTRTNQQPSQKGGNSFLWLAVVVCALLVVCFIYFMVEMIKSRSGRGENTGTDREDDEVMLNLDPSQRRAVLEAIFSETTKAVTSSVFTRALDPTEKAAQMSKFSKGEKQPSSLPTIATTSTNKFKIPESRTRDESIAEESLQSPVPYETSLSPAKTAETIETPSSNTTASPETEEMAVEDVETARVCSEEPNPRMFAGPWDSETAGHDVSLSLPSLKAEDCKDEEFGPPSLKPSPVSRLPQDVSPQVPDVPTASEENRSESSAEEDDGEEVVCAICLSGYQDGDVAIASKYCSHLFHKECIFEWLGKNDDCPCCRVEMVTKGDVNEAAKNIVGTTSIINAAQSLNSASEEDQQTPTGTPPSSPRSGSRQSP